MLSQTAPDGQGQADVEALLLLIQGVVDDHHAARFFPLALVEAEDAAVLLWAGDVVRKGQDGGWNRPHGGTFEEEEKKKNSSRIKIYCADE